MLADDAFHKVNPKEYYKKKVLEAGPQARRPDGRQLNECRKISIKLGSLSNADGSALIKLGKTSVLCGLKLEVGVPLATAPKRGRLEVSVGLSPLCSPKFSGNTGYRASDQSVAMAEQLLNTTLSSGCIDLNELCIVSGSSVWCVYADLVCLNFDGNVLDACFVALVAALKNLRLPETQIDDSGVVCVTEQRTGKLSVAHALVPLTFGFIDEKYVVCDPTSEEEDFLSGTVTVVYTDAGKLCGVFKPGGTGVGGLSPATMRDYLFPRAKLRVQEIASKLSAAAAAPPATDSAAASATAAAPAPAAKGGAQTAKSSKSK